MRLPWRKHSDDKPNPQQARKALADEVKRLEQIRSETPFYKALGDSLREVRERNHLGEAIEFTFRGKA